MNPEKRADLLEYIGEYDDPYDINRAVPLELFFEGNDVEGSIWPNLDAFVPEDAYEILLEIRERDDVQDVFVLVSQFEEEDEDDWPFAETVIVVTSVAEDEVIGWFDEACAPDEVESGVVIEDLPVPVPAGYSVITVWWD